ncbi:MAG TPA: GxxExxY protein [Pyrinomonadaceae bacterium]|jgi:GxxExxY protein
MQSQTSPLIEKLLKPGDAAARSAEVNQLCDVIRQTSFEIHKFLRSGHLEKVYENALAHRLSKLGISLIQQHPLDVCDEDGTLLGHFCADLFVESKLVVEIKACKCLVDDHIAQLLGYLRASRIEHGLLINFGGQKFKLRNTFSAEICSYGFSFLCLFVA